MSDMSRSQRPSSKAPHVSSIRQSSTRQSSKAPYIDEDEPTVLASASTRDASKAPRMSSTMVSSTRQSSKAPYIDEDEPPILASASTKGTSKAPPMSSTMASSTRQSSKAPYIDEDEPTILPSAVTRDVSHAPQKSRISSSRLAPREAKTGKSVIQAIPEDEEMEFQESLDDFEDIDKSKRPDVAGSKMQSSRAKSTYYDAEEPESGGILASRWMLDKSMAPKPTAMLASRYMLDQSRAASKSQAVSASRWTADDEEQFKSHLTTKKDVFMSKRQTMYDSLSPEDQEKQEEWAQEQIKKMAPCPEAYRFDRIRQGGWSGYCCSAGTHAMIDSQFEEGLGALIVLGKPHNIGNENAVRHGPWYPHPTIANCYVHRPEEKFLIEGVIPWNHPSFMGKEKQRWRAKWQYHKANPTTAKDSEWGRKSSRLSEEPPEAWEFDTSEPTEEEREWINAHKING